MLARGELQTIGATTLDEYRKYLEKDAALERRFQPIQVAEPSIAHTIEMLKGLRDRYEAHHRRHHHRRGAGLGGDAGRPLHLRPVPARQGHRPDRRGRVAAADPPDDGARRPARVRRQDRRRCQRKEAAIDGQDFEAAARLRDEEKQLIPRSPSARSSGAPATWTSRRGRRGADRRGARRRDRHPDREALRGGVHAAAQDGGRAAQARHRPGGGRQGHLPRDPSYPRRHEGPQRPGGSFIFAGPRASARPGCPRRSRSSSSATRTR